ncbi:MAG: sodium:solute symporter family transporter [Bacillota bacterium]|jgi:SSS family solute:Na+ symporter
MKYVVIGIYVFVLLAIGYVSMKKTHSVNDFFLGNRTIGPWVSAFAYGTTYFSAVIFIGYAGKIGWGFGLSSLWIVAGNAFIGTYLAWKVLAKPTREITARLGALTMPDFLAKRYDSPSLKIAAALIIFIFLVPYSASVYMGLSYLFEEIFSIPFTMALLFIAALTGLYLVMGGYFAVTLTDFIQGTIMLAGVGLLLFYVITDAHVGGLAAGLAKLAGYGPKLVQPFNPPNPVGLLSLVILTSLGTWGLPQMVQKFYSIRDEKAIPPARVVSTIFALVVAFGAYFTGSLGRLFFDNQMPQGNPDLVVPLMISTALPETAAVLILLLVLAASMSTLASLVLVSSSAIAMDLVQGTLWPEIERRKVMILMRFLSVLFIALSVYIALKPTFILTLMALSWGTVAGAFLGPYLYGLFWKGATRAGAWAGMITGLTTSVGLALYYRMDGSLIPTIGSAAILLPLLVVPLVSIFSPKFSAEHLETVYGTAAVTAEYGQERLVTDDLG